MKRGQVTIFIIVGIIALIAVVLVLYTQSEFFKSFIQEQQARLSGIPQEIEPVNQYMQSCIKAISSISLDFVLLQGGYSDPDEYVEVGIARVPYWYNKKDISPSLKFIENQLTEYMNTAIYLCIDEYTGEGLINLEETKTKVTIKEKEIIFNIKPNLDINLNDLTYRLDKTYNFNLDSDAYDLIQESKKIINSEVKDPNSIDFTLLNSLKYDVELINLENNEIVYSLSSDKNTIMFANKF